MDKTILDKKWKKTIFVGFLVSIAAQIKLDAFSNGFIIALSVLVMVIFMYCYEELSPRYIAYWSGIFSPFFRMINIVIGGNTVQNAILLASPDIFFFMTYGTLYPIIYKYVIKEKKTIRNFPYVITISDVMSNMVEFVVRSILLHKFLFSFKLIAYLCLIAFVRMVLIQTIIVAIEAYSSFLLKREHDYLYRKLISQAAIFESELHIMEKNASEIESIMKNAFKLYKEMETFNVSRTFIEEILAISKSAHEVKGDYVGIISALRRSYIDSIKGRKLSLRDIISIEKANALAYAKANNIKIEIDIGGTSDFYTSDFYKLMSVLRNLIINGVEACKDKGGLIYVYVREKDDNIVITIKDDGKGIKESNMDSIFLTGFSTKFNMVTGDIQRGIGLAVVKDYVENDFGGTISVESELGKYTKFSIKIPVSRVEIAN